MMQRVHGRDVCVRASPARVIATVHTYVVGIPARAMRLGTFLLRAEECASLDSSRKIVHDSEGNFIIRFH